MRRWYKNRFVCWYGNTNTELVKFVSKISWYDLECSAQWSNPLALILLHKISCHSVHKITISWWPCYLFIRNVIKSFCVPFSHYILSRSMGELTWVKETDTEKCAFFHLETNHFQNGMEFCVELARNLLVARMRDVHLPHDDYFGADKLSSFK